MIRFDQRNFDVQATERVFKKVVHPSHHAIRLVDKDGIPLRTPTTQALSRLHSTYVLSPRGVPTKKSNHSYSGQLTQAKMQNLVKNFEPVQSQELQSYTSMHNYGSGLSSAGSSRHYMPSNLTPKKRGFGSGPPRSVKSMPAKSASSQRTGRFLTSATATDIGHDPDDMALDGNEKTNDSPQGKRLEKEWTALSQCRALKRSSEIVSHRVDRMYFMTGNKLKLQSKYHVEDDELKQLRELSQAQASSRASRSSKSRKGDVYRPIRSSLSQKAHTSREDLRDQTRSASLLQKENADPSIVVSQKPITQKPSGIKSPLLGWAEDKTEKALPETNDLVYQNGLHKDKDSAELQNEETDDKKQDEGSEDEENAGNDGKPDVKASERETVSELNGKAEVEENEIEHSVEVKNVEKKESVTFLTEGQASVEDVDKVKCDDGKSVPNSDEKSVSSDKDKTVVKSEDYISRETTDVTNKTSED